MDDWELTIVDRRLIFEHMIDRKEDLYTQVLFFIGHGASLWIDAWPLKRQRNDG